MSNILDINLLGIAIPSLVRHPEKCEHTSGFNVHHNRYRYNWLVSLGGVPVVPGTDVVELNHDGKAVRVDGFFGPAPKK